MASIEWYQTKKGKRWRVRYRKPDGKSTDKSGFLTKKAAEGWSANVEVDIQRGQYVAPKDGRVTVGELGASWLKRQTHLKESAYRPLEASWRLRVLPRWGEVALSDIVPSDVQAWVSTMTKGDPAADVAPLGATVVIRTYGVLASIIDDAVKDRLIYSNPARGVNLPRKVRGKHVYLTHQQAHALAAECGDRGALVLLFCYCGLRWSEAVGLRVHSLDLLRRRALIEEGAVQLAGLMQVGTTKSHRKRTVPLPEFLVDALAAQCQGKARGDLLFPGGNGEYLTRPRAQDGWFDRAVKKAGVPRVTPHDLRHTAASLAVSAGANVKAVQKMLGHSSAAMTLDVYSDLFDDDLTAVATALHDQARNQGVGGLWEKKPLTS